MRMNQYNKSREYYEEISYSQKKKKKKKSRLNKEIFTYKYSTIFL
jgi:hypothetical protein